MNGRTIGTLLPVSTTQANTDTPAGGFLSAVNRSTWVSGLLAAGVALILGSLLFLQIVAPVRRLTVAARDVAAGGFQKIPVTSQDEIGQLSTAFNQMAETLARQRELRQTMMADIAHELRTPLSVIQGNLEAMLDGVLPSSPEEIASLRDETALLARLVTDLRLLSLAEAGQLKLEPIKIDLSELLGRIIEHMRPQAEAGQVEIQVEIYSGLPKLTIDPDRMAQVFHNLLANALQHTPAGGQILIQASLQPGQENRPGVVVEVTDTGCGIPADDLPYVFDRFYRAEKSHIRSSGGSGIGLAIVKQLVEAHGGKVRVESPAFSDSDKKGPGSRFLVSLPV
jgi:signal transduction histidine kinase